MARRKCYVCSSKSKKVTKYGDTQLCPKCLNGVKYWESQPRDINESVRDIAKRMKRRCSYKKNKEKKRFTPAKASKPKTVIPTITEEYFGYDLNTAEEISSLDTIFITGVSGDKYQLNEKYWLRKEFVEFR